MSALWTSEAIASACGGSATAWFAAGGVSIDTRTLRPGDLFVALVGESGDGHAHLARAAAAGACGALVHDERAGAGDLPLVVVGDTLDGLTALGRAGRDRFAGRVIAVTGSVGKTTTKEMLRVALGVLGRVQASEASYNNHWGVPLTLARLAPDADYAVLEIGMNHPGEILPLARLARPHAAIVTAIAAAHIGNMGSIEAIADEKGSIAHGLEPGGVVILPAEDAQFGRLVASVGGANVATFGAGGDVALLSVESDTTGSRIEATIEGRPLRFALAAPGRHMALNALACLTAVASIGGDVVRAAEALAGFAPGAGRGLLTNLLDGQAILLDESYNANGASMRAALSVLSMQTARRRVAVLGDMLELGEFANAEHVGLAPEVDASADLLFTCGPLSRALFDAVSQSRRGAHAANSAELAPIVAEALRPGDAVLVKGSLGSRMRVIVDALRSARVAVA